MRQVKIVLTGGPAGGKSKGLKRIKECQEILELGWDVVTTPESATIIIPCGFSPPKFLKLPDRKKYLEMQKLIFNTHLFLEDSIKDTAKEVFGELVLMTHDRGIPDIKCYNTEEEYQNFLHSRKMFEIEARDGRYDAVFHLATIADTDPELYMKIYGENEARYEDTPEKAIAADLKTRAAWLGHPHFRVIPNRTLDGKILSFEEKMRLLTLYVKQILAENPLEVEKKFFLHNPVELATFPVPFVKIEIEQIYLSGAAHKDRIRRRTQNGHSLYYRTRKKSTKTAGVKTEKERKIGHEEYEGLKELADRHRRPILKDRIHFLWKNQSFELDIYRSPEQIAGMAILENELLSEEGLASQNAVEVPEWLGKYDDVTGKKEYSNRSLARK